MVKSYHFVQCRPILVRNWTERSHIVITLKQCAKKLSTRVSLLRRLASSGWGTAALSLIYSTAEYCAPAWCRSAHTCLIDSVLNDGLCVVTECLRPTPTENLPVLSRIQPAELRRQGVTLSLANRSSLDAGHILHSQLTESHAASKVRLKSRHPFVLPRGNYCTT